MWLQARQPAGNLKAVESYFEGGFFQTGKLKPPKSNMYISHTGRATLKLPG